MSKNSKSNGDKKMKDKEYVKELRKLQARAVPAPGVGQAQGPARHHRLRGPRRRRQGRHHPRHHRARQPARVPRSSRCRRRPTARSRRCTCSATCSISRRRAKS